MAQGKNDLLSRKRVMVLARDTFFSEPWWLEQRKVPYIPSLCILSTKMIAKWTATRPWYHTAGRLRMFHGRVQSKFSRNFTCESLTTPIGWKHPISTWSKNPRSQSPWCKAQDSNIRRERFPIEIILPHKSDSANPKFRFFRRWCNCLPLLVWVSCMAPWKVATFWE